MAITFTDKWIEAQKPTSTRQEIADAATKGLYLFIQPSGVKSWVYRYRTSDGLRKMVLGTYPKVDLATARAGAGSAKDLRTGDEPKDPIAERKERLRLRAEAAREKLRLEQEEANKEQRLFQPMVERYLNEYAKERRSYSEKARLLGLSGDDSDWKVRPGSPVAKWGQLSIDRPALEWREDVRTYGKGMVAAGTGYLANRTFAELRGMFNWMHKNDILIPSPLLNMDVPFKGGEKERDRTLLRETETGTYGDELRWLWRASDTEPVFGPWIKLLILTGMRQAKEVAAMTWEQIDYSDPERPFWLIPDIAAKNGKPHRVALSVEAMAVLESVATAKDRKGYVFTTTGKTQEPVAITPGDKLKKRMDALMLEIGRNERGEPVEIKRWVWHDLRRTCATGMQLLGYEREMVERILNHRKQTKLERTYQTATYRKDARKAWQAWADGVGRILDGKMLELPEKEQDTPEPPSADNVVQLRQTA